MKLWGKSTMKLFSMEISVEGSPPKPPFFIVSNHLSYIDIPIYSSVLDTTFVSKIEIKHWPLIGFMARTLGIIFIDRRKKSDVHRVNKKISTDLNQHQGVILFPEGTTSPGVEVMRFRPSLLQHAALSEMSVSYAALRFETFEPDLPAYKSVCWWGDVSMLRHLYLMGKNRKIHVQIRFGNEKVFSNDRKELADILHQRVSELFVPVTENMDEIFEPLNL